MIETAENIHLAAYNDEIDILKKIYENNPSDVFKLSLSGNNCLHIAAASNSLRVLRFLIEINDHSLLNSLNKWKETALHLGTAAGNVDVVIILLEAGANVLLSDQWNRTPKMVAMQYGFTKCLELLHQYDPSTVVESIHPPPSLDAGWDSRYQQITKEFLEVQHTRINTIRQAEVIEQHIFSSLTVPIVSINPVVPGLPSLSKLIEYPGDPDQLRLLLTERKVNPAGKDMLGYTALHKFSSWDKVDLLEILCPQKINSYYQLEGKRT